MANENDDTRAEKLKKISALREQGVELYPYSFDVTTAISKIRDEFDGKLAAEDKTEHQAGIAGRIMLKRGMGGVLFMDLADEDATIQLFFQKNQLHDNFKLAQEIDLGDIIGVHGTVFKTKLGELSVWVESFRILTKSLTGLADKYHGLKDVELRYRNRSLDMVMNPESRQVLKKRFLMTQAVREYMVDSGYLEVETPITQVVYGGAAAKPFTTHHHKLDMDMFLRVAPEQNLKKLLAGGMEAVFEIGKNFRNENTDRTHNPEFTMLEAYRGYVDYTAMIDLLEGLVEHVCMKLFGTLEITSGGQEISFARPWKQLTVKDALKQLAGIDADALSDDELFGKVEKLNKEFHSRTRGEATLILFEEYCEEKLIQPTHIIDYPKESTPFSKVNRKDDTLIERFESFVLGRELANAYSELNDPVLQRTLLEEQVKMADRGADEIWGQVDEEFLSAMELGIPPAGGIGIGLDRLAMTLLNQDSIRDIIYFPTMKPRD